MEEKDWFRNHKVDRRVLRFIYPGLYGLYEKSFIQINTPTVFGTGYNHAAHICTLKSKKALTDCLHRTEHYTIESSSSQIFSLLDVWRIIWLWWRSLITTSHGVF